MKKFLGILLSVCMLLGLAVIPAAAADVFWNRVLLPELIVDEKRRRHIDQIVRVIGLHLHRKIVSIGAGWWQTDFLLSAYC